MPRGSKCGAGGLPGSGCGCGTGVPPDVGLRLPNGVGAPQFWAGVPPVGTGYHRGGTGDSQGSGCRVGTSRCGTEDTRAGGAYWRRRSHPCPHPGGIEPGGAWHRPCHPRAGRCHRGPAGVGDMEGGWGTPIASVVTPPSPAGGPGAPRRWPTTEVRQCQRCMSPVFPPLGWGRLALTCSVPPDVRFVTEESFDFGVLSPSDSQEEEEDEDSPGGGWRHKSGNGRWSPLRGARLEEMVREATRLAAQLEGCHLPPPAPGEPPGPAATPPGTPRSPRRQTFVVKDSPVRALLPTVESKGPAPIPRLPAKPPGASAATSVPEVSRRQGGVQSPACPPAASPTPGPPPHLSPLAVPLHPLPSPRCPLGLQQWVGGPPLPEVWGQHGQPPQLLPRGANQDPPLPACGPHARRR
ncbi:proline/serine-rich coiled-coil protein 1 isoform X2 [Poecile atricapillus]|uniref:proline/serine-rich coiled-coil protein 1 isoform X2 n=1 Tax=Poecile atricapillus TaxID=48891 RepID=UPI00273997C5|nr:proline/serine-rich coiled-coil protein 1 isoform X2 [Poecile atricapillus]